MPCCRGTHLHLLRQHRQAWDAVWAALLLLGLLPALARRAVVVPAGAAREGQAVAHPQRN